MGFFSDLKDDLSQAVNEMMPEEEEGMQVNKPASDSMDDVDLAAAETVSEVAEEPVAAIPEPAPAPEPVFIPEPAVKPEPPASQTEAVREYLGNNSPAMNVSNQVLDETAVVTQGMAINGDVTTQGSLDLVGAIIGNVSALGKLSITGAIRGDSRAAEIYAEGAQINGNVNSDGAVKIGQSTVIIGNISGTSAVIAGAVKGDIDVRGPVILDGTAIVMGNIKSKYVQINNGAVIEGMCSQCYADVNPTSFFEELKKSF